MARTTVGPVSVGVMSTSGISALGHPVEGVRGGGGPDAGLDQGT
ncbi:hypothetical protein AB0D34_01440 [Streptomyces sp. NPDC048420]